MKRKTEFVAIVREQRGFIRIGKITSKKLEPFIGKKVKVTVEILK